MEEIIKLCGQSERSQFQMEEQAPLMQLNPQSSKTKTYRTDRIPSSAWERFTNPVAASSYQEKAINTWEHQPLPNYQFEKDSLLPEKTEFSPLDVNPYVESIKLQKKGTNKINTFSSLFWGNHPQRKRRGFLEKCCLQGCTKEELAVVCLPYVDFET
ncbi:insulin-like peptide INSL6 [Sigmodon hispidus]